MTAATLIAEAWEEADQQRALVTPNNQRASDTAKLLDRLADALETALADTERLRQACEPFQHFVRIWDASPPRGTADEFYTVHLNAGSASLKVSDFRILSAAIDAARSQP